MGESILYNVLYHLSLRLTCFPTYTRTHKVYNWTYQAGVQGTLGTSSIAQNFDLKPQILRAQDR